MRFFPGTMTTQAESINSDLLLGLDRHLRTRDTQMFQVENLFDALNHCATAALSEVICHTTDKPYISALFGIERHGVRVIIWEVFPKSGKLACLKPEKEGCQPEGVVFIGPLVGFKTPTLPFFY